MENREINDIGKTYFAVSDIHGFYSQFRNALKRSGFDLENPNHILIVCGDIFDRGPGSKGVYKFLRSISKERRILIRGNHETLLRDLYNRGYAWDHDFTNGTVDTLYQLAGLGTYDKAFEKAPKLNPDPFLDEETRSAEFSRYLTERREYWDKIDAKLYNSPKVEEILEWIASDEWVDYYELGDYVFVHSWIPVVEKMTSDGDRKLAVPKDWRTRPQYEWEDAAWGCPWKKALQKLNPEGKTIVCGHWHAWDFHTHLGHDIDGFRNRNIFFGDIVIALDACTAMEPHKCNVLVIENGMCYDQSHKLLGRARSIEKKRS